MSLTPEIRRELNDLLGMLRDGRLDEDRLARLDALVAAAPNARRLYINYVDLCASLHWTRREKCEGGGISYDNTSGENEIIATNGLGLGVLETNESPLAVSGFAGLETDNIVGANIESQFPLLSPLPSLSTNFVGGPVFSYMVASVVLCLMLLGAWSYKVVRLESLPSHIAEHTDPHFPTIVGQITGMEKCRWGEDEPGTIIGASVPLGRKYSLESGLLQITYKTGANVILEGPCVFKADSAIGGYLGLGKLTARVEKRGEGREEGGGKEVASGQWLVARSEGRGRDANHSPLSTLHSPLFTISTPTAVVTDMGTEFGVEVDTDGTTTSHVFRGTVRVHVLGNDPQQEVVLRDNESARVEKEVNGAQLVLRHAVGEMPKFVRQLAGTLISPNSINAIDGSIFQDDFDGATVDSNKWAIFALEDGTVSVTDGLATIRSKLFPPKGVASLCCAHALDFSSSPEDWWAEIRFKMDGELSSSFRIMRDWIVFAGVSMTSGKRVIQGFDLRAMQRGTTDSATFDLGWHGWDYAYRERIPVALARNLNKGQFYTVKIHRKPDSTVDIYLDDRLIAGKPLIASQNPVLLRCGDISMFIGGTQVIDYVNMGSLIRHASVSNNEKRKEGRPMKQ